MDASVNTTRALDEPGERKAEESLVVTKQSACSRV